MGNKMRIDIIKALKNLCYNASCDLNEIENYIISNCMSGEELGITAILLVDACFMEYGDFVEKYNRNPKSTELISSKFPNVIKLFLKYNLNPNTIYKWDENNESCILGELQYIDNPYIAPQVMKYLLENGADPNLYVDGETVFEKYNFDIVFDVVELDNKNLFDIEFMCWLVLLGYGGKLSNGKEPLKMVNGETYKIFKEYQLFDYTIEYNESDWIMHIINKETGKEVAVLE